MKHRSSRRVLRLVALSAAIVVTAAGCSSKGGAQSTTDTTTKKYTIAMVTHETPGDTFWNKIRAGAEAAAKQDNVTLKYSNDPDASKQAQLIQAAVDSKVDGIATTLATPDALKGSVQKALGAKIPVVAFNSGIDQYKEVGASMYFGSDENLAGQTAGQRIAKAGAKNVLCVIQAQGSVALEARCAGVKKGVANTTNLNVNGNDDASVTSTIAAKLQQDPSIDYVVTLGAPIAVDALQSISQAKSSAKLITFDLNADAAKDIQDGKIQFAIDQQPYVQGFMAVQALWLNLSNGDDIGGGKPVLTGPSFVDSSNIAQILPYAKNNTR